MLERLGLGEVLEKAMKEGAGRARTCYGKTRAGRIGTRKGTACHEIYVQLYLKVRWSLP